MPFLTLNFKAVVVSLVVGAAMIVFGKDLGLFFFGEMFFFVVLAAIVTLAGKKFKQNAGLYEKSRGIKNVLANGLWPLVMSAAFYATYTTGHSHLALFAALGFIASVGAVTSDTFSSELGVLDGRPVMILGFRKVQKGVSGGVTWLGLAAGFGGALLISAAFVVVLPELSALGLSSYILAFIVLTISSFFGTIADSVLGYFEEKGIGSKYTSNFFGSMAGSALCVALAAMFAL
ncbi:MAG: DUF92 domain-containing protein [Candidatus Marsarchaeota archaeon]|jgi:uncharacterized protein (TIGR00297 family)|nr:DUF92 domain-containing protein [Candidatus Marsarchaeota archaeon]